jgi:hypothetical protein
MGGPIRIWKWIDMSEAESIGLTADVLVIGFGKGGKDLAGTMGREGKRVVMVE